MQANKVCVTSVIVTALIPADSPHSLIKNNNNNQINECVHIGSVLGQKRPMLHCFFSFHVCKMCWVTPTVETDGEELII